MIGKPIFNVWFSRLAEPDEVWCDAMRRSCNQRNDIPPYVRRGRVPVQKKRDRSFGISRFPVGHGGTQNIHLGQYNIRTDGHFLLLLLVECGWENTVWKTMFLKRSSAAGPRSTFIRRIAPSQEARRNSARSIGSNVEFCAERPGCSKAAKWSPFFSSLSPLRRAFGRRLLQGRL